MLSRPDIKPAAPASREVPANVPCQVLGYIFQPITAELIELLTLAGSPVVQMIPIIKKYYPKLGAARSKLKRMFVLTQMRVEGAAKIRETPDDSLISTFILVTDTARSRELLKKHQLEFLLAAARWEFGNLKSDELKRLCEAAGEHFGEHIIAGILKGAVR
jgi:hypothetical protein